MSDANLVDEFERYAAGREHFPWFERLKIDPYAGGIGRQRVGVGKIITSPSGFFEFHEQGRGALIIPEGRALWPECGVGWAFIEDMVAVSSRNPDEWWRRTGAAWSLGADNLEDARVRRKTLKLFPNPLEWCRNRCEGAVILDWELDLRAGLDGIPLVICGDDELKVRLERALARQARPSFKIEVQRRAA